MPTCIIEQLKLSKLQQMTFLNYKDNNTFKALVGISPDGSVSFVSSLYPGCISDKELTKYLICWRVGPSLLCLKFYLLYF